MERGINVNPLISNTLTRLPFHQREASAPDCFNVNRKFWVAIVMMASLVFGCDAISSGTAQNVEKTKGENAMELAIEKESTAVVIPPIDASAPQQTATATFAMG